MVNENDAVEPGLEPFIKDFHADRAKEWQQAKQWLIHGEFEQARQLFHKWKGMCKPYGYGTLVKLTEDIHTRILEQKHINEEDLNNFFSYVEDYIRDKEEAL